MAEKQWAILEEVERLTEENAANFLSPSVYGQAKIKGKYIRDANGKLVPVLVKTRTQVQVQVQQPGAVQYIKEEIREPEKSGVINRFQKWLRSFFL